MIANEEAPLGPGGRPHRARVSRGRRAARHGLVAVLVAAGLASGVSTAVAHEAPRSDDVQRSLDLLVRDEQVPAALASVSSRGRSDSYVSGTSRRGTSEPVPADGQVRAGSNTKTFTAVVVLQLVAEGLVELDAPIDRYLPGLVQGSGVDGRVVTVRQLLQHTSGLPDYVRHIGLERFEQLRDTYFEPRDLLDAALAHPAGRAPRTPGAGWEYSNTNYLLAGMLIQHVTGRPVEEEVTERVIDRIGLRHTYWPAAGDRAIRGPHPRGYALDSTGTVVDATELDTSAAWAAGALVSTPSDLHTFFSALLDGKLLPAAQLAEMRSTVPASIWPGSRYGLGLVSTPLTCGGEYWGHGGDIQGYETRGGATEDGRAATVAVTAMPGTFGAENAQRAVTAVMTAVDTALCSVR